MPRDGEPATHEPFGDPKIPSDVDDWRHVETVRGGSRLSKRPKPHRNFRIIAN